MLGHAPLVPRSFEVPLRVETDKFVLVPLFWRGFHLDFEAYMSSVEHLQQTFDHDNDPVNIIEGQRWPAGTDLEWAFVDAAWSQFEWQLRTSFTYVPLSLEENRQLGCGYIVPCKKSDFDVELQTWVRADQLANGFDEEFFSWFRRWVDEVWPFEGLRIVCPGREIHWDEYNALPDQSVASLIERARGARA